MMKIDQDAYNEGRNVWGKAIGSFANPYYQNRDPERFHSWNKGYMDAEEEAEAIFQKTRAIQLEKEAEAERREQEIKEKKKTKKGRAELAGQEVLF